MDALAISIGRHHGRPELFRPKQRLLHSLFVGMTGSGKSNAMSYMAQKDLILGNSIIFLDPHGEETPRHLRWMEAMGIAKDRANLFDVTGERLIGINPLYVEEHDEAIIARVAGRLVDAVSIVFNQKSENLPQLQRILNLAFQYTAYHGGTLMDVPGVLASTDIHKRKRELRMGIGNHFIYSQLDELLAVGVKNLRLFMDIVQSAYNRFTMFLKNERMQFIFGQTEGTLDIGGIIERGESLLINTHVGRYLDESDTRLLNCLIVNEVFKAAQNRPKDARPVMVYLDEAPMYLNHRIPHILQESRKRGVALHMACQHLYQLREVDEAIFQSVMNNTANKFVHRTASTEDCKILADELFDYQLDIPKVIQKQVVGYNIIHLNGETETDNWSKTKTDSWNEDETISLGQQVQLSFQEDNSKAKAVADTKGNALGSGDVAGSMTGVRGEFEDAVPMSASSNAVIQTETDIYARTKALSEAERQGRSISGGMNRSVARKKGRGGSLADARGGSKGKTVQESLLPILEDNVTQFESIEERRHKRAWQIKKMKPGQVLYSHVGKDPIQLDVPLVLDYDWIGPERLESFIEAIYARQQGEHYLKRAERVRELRNQVFGIPALTRGDGAPIRGEDPEAEPW